MAYQSSTLKFIAIGFVFAFLTNLPFYGWIFNKEFPNFINGFPIGWLGAGMRYMATFFHEIGHTVFMWFFGYPTIPVFDFAHGGGMAVAITGQQIPILLAVWAGLAYLFYLAKEYISVRIIIVAIFLFNITFAFNEYHAVILDFAGPAFECLFAGFFLYRCLLDLAPRGAFERFLNAYFGIGMIMQVFINGYGLIMNKAYRLVYYQQKGAHGFGDFDKIAERLNFLDFNGVVYAWLILNIICIIIPLYAYINERTYQRL